MNGSTHLREAGAAIEFVTTKIAIKLLLLTSTTFAKQSFSSVTSTRKKHVARLFRTSSIRVVAAQVGLQARANHNQKGSHGALSSLKHVREKHVSVKTNLAAATSGTYVVLNLVSAKMQSFIFKNTCKQ